jgi:site-specific DNA-methyltransferase (adenine-specific)
MKSLRNKTIQCSYEEKLDFSNELIYLDKPTKLENITNKIIYQNFFEAVEFLPDKFVDLLILDVPYNLTKYYGNNVFYKKSNDEYVEWFEILINLLVPKLSFIASIYICFDWQTSAIIYPILNKYFFVRNRITWGRDKGRGCNSNWKNNMEDIWFCTLSKSYYFNIIKLKRKVKAPYVDNNKKPKDWKNNDGEKYRLTYPSNFWNDITVPFWSMSENTQHPTQKSEKLIAKLILASSNKGDFVFDPFLGSGTSAVVAKKLERNFCGIESNLDYCCTTIKRLKMAEKNNKIQDYLDGVFILNN